MAESAKLRDNLIQLLDEHSNLIAVAKKDISHLLELLRKDIRMIVHRAEDAIDKFLVKAMLRQEINAAAKLFYFANRIASRRSYFIEEIRDIIVRMEEIKQNNQVDLSPSLVDLVPSNEEELQDPFLEDDEVCGFEEKAQQLIKQLLEGSNDTGYVSIVGMPGLGKTTLAKIIYNNVQISENFDCKIWVYVGKSDKMKDVCLNILKWFSESIKEYQDKNEDELAKVIFDFLTERKRCLIVLDDVWHPTVVSFVEPFSKNKKGDRIMITTRSQTVAQYANINPYNMKFLTSEESIRLLERRTFGFRSCPDELLGHVKSIAEKCNGVPLAITVIARALRGRRNKKDWKRVEKNVLQHLLNKNDPKSCLKFVEMNYDYLPEEKKACFLYCATFPRASDIPAWKLILLWIAEGLIKSQAEFSLEETAAFYLNDLALRNLVLVKKRSADGQIKTCRVHDMLHEFCKMEAASESLFQECLEVLKLKDNAFMGMLWKPKRGGFSHLEVLWIEKADFIYWKASDRHFPMLRHLVLISCDTLRAVPYAFANISNLQEMWLKNTINAINSAEKIECKKQETQAPDGTAFKLIRVLPENDPNAAQ
ncbi:toMV susceptible protein tm-2-like [Lycium barbarum]|uniref:toMV susceptible protein tm-2-like n=1 Tax=Lycium barbarum TaxID=112863 RepID=UPI00293EA56D|nr:toMV susceptible protein tm-2-like [Lycium barbarum]